MLKMGPCLIPLSVTLDLGPWLSNRGELQNQRIGYMKENGFEISSTFKNSKNRDLANT